MLLSGSGEGIVNAMVSYSLREENMSRQTVVAAMVVAQKAALLGLLDHAGKTDPGIDARIQGVGQGIRSARRIEGRAR